MSEELLRSATESCSNIYWDGPHDYDFAALEVVLHRLATASDLALKHVQRKNYQSEENGRLINRLRDLMVAYIGQMRDRWAQIEDDEPTGDDPKCPICDYEQKFHDLLVGEQIEEAWVDALETYGCNAHNIVDMVVTEQFACVIRTRCCTACKSEEIGVDRPKAMPHSEQSLARFECHECGHRWLGR